MVGKLRLFHPSHHDTGIFLWLFLIGTGWNLSTALAIDVSEETRWVDDHPHGTNFKVLHAFKDRAVRHQFADTNHGYLLGAKLPHYVASPPSIARGLVVVVHVRSLFSNRLSLQALDEKV
jgi:hypothetical protein